MKFSKKIILAYLASTICSFSWVFASWIDHFEVEFTPNEVKVNESLDLTIEAVDKNNATVLDYKGTILIFSESDPEAELPSALEENTYTFSAADQWKIKFENWVKFKSIWIQNIHIYDLNDDTVFWVAEASVSWEAVVTNLDISIISPESWLTIWENSIVVSWTTQKNYQVKIIINWTEEYLTTSNDDWIFEKKVENLEDWNSTIKAQILDADSNVVWESEEVSIKIELNSLNIKNIKLTPETVDAWDSFEIEVISNPWLTDINAVINDILIKLEETTEWTYVAKSVAPNESGTYWVDINIQDELGHKKTELWAASLTVNEVVLQVADEPVLIEETAETVEENRELKITWLKLVELKTKSILTWDEIEDVESYNVYKKVSEWELELIENVETPRFEVEIVWDDIKYDYFAVKAVAKTASWELYEWSLSEATKVKTGPEILILILISLFIWWFMFIRKKA